tara:strand:+ start:30 stop:725 length:696 start_codon:yes stop_codon:yes gene_type:complete
MESFFVGAISAMTATMATHPLDVIKVRKQMSPNCSYKRLFAGLPDALKRQVFYSGIRFGLYDNIGPYRTLSLSEKMLKGAFVGSVGAFVATPFDLAKVQKQAQVGNLKKKNILDFWRGGWPTVIRAAIVTSSQISSFYHTKEWLISGGFEGPVDITASITAGVCTSLISNPMDVIKTWRMSGIISKPQIPDVLSMVRQHGVLSLYRGLGATVMRMCPYVTIMFLIKENLIL